MAQISHENHGTALRIQWPEESDNSPAELWADILRHDGEMVLAVAWGDRTAAIRLDADTAVALADHIDTFLAECQ